MIAGSIPGSTRTLSTSIYAYAESGMDEQALVLVVVSALLSFGSVLYANRLTAGWDAGR
jgi:ABC-type molybdate transport system permease subunit